MLVALHPQPSAVRTSNEPLAPPVGAFALVDDSVKAQPCPWLTVKVLPAIVAVPDREGPLVAATATFTVPLPLPLPPDAIVIHGTELDVVHEQPDPAVTLTGTVPPDEGTDCVSGEIANVQPWPWVTVMVCPATVNVPDREGPFVDAIENVTVPGPFPPPEAIVIQGALLDAVHGQPEDVFTVTLRDPPLASAVWLSGDTSNAQPAVCVTVKICPAIVIVPVRVGPDVACTLNATVPRPTPELTLTEIQLTLLTAVQGHPGPAVTVITLDPPGGVA